MGRWRIARTCIVEGEVEGRDSERRRMDNVLFARQNIAGIIANCRIIFFFSHLRALIQGVRSRVPSSSPRDANDSLEVAEARDVLNWMSRKPHAKRVEQRTGCSFQTHPDGECFISETYPSGCASTYAWQAVSNSGRVRVCMGRAAQRLRGNVLYSYKNKVQPHGRVPTVEHPPVRACWHSRIPKLSPSNCRLSLPAVFPYRIPSLNPLWLLARSVVKFRYLRLRPDWRFNPYMSSEQAFVQGQEGYQEEGR